MPLTLHNPIEQRAQQAIDNSSTTLRRSGERIGYDIPSDGSVLLPDFLNDLLSLNPHPDDYREALIKLTLAGNIEIDTTECSAPAA
jgi:hypothetical protein